MSNIGRGLKRNSRKGFTLVELLVVLVILAILAAAIIPSMMGFIDRAKQESVAAEQRSVLLAAQVELNELYGKGSIHLTDTEQLVTDDSGKRGELLESIQKTANVPGRVTKVVYTKNAVEGKNDGHWTVTEARYTAKDGRAYTYTYDAESRSGAWTADH
ncbi:prepilin-type N-terminal cleavage/methylation domain-containing protein [Neglectibacter timonensis]|uniref:Prepilin-type N-terminal cleavage/methylation domain-containing protein n=1 Tax=Neglectibacter timonensis TaxID=1776382 RepID=A0ABT1S270_9FIRM|nr:prepilin-type N-terminal cleavage/methylation domain-containing protein [Neglectibacter timonensis]MCQ4841023.1 prepilin-type N-terminal cleavage/methylation domain-containing protein [Neglectibacter timonensis]MCQ4844661.1 prepilin-type N-terminal cleavage/methylation domain-containing protein [Neglectibacter timonensis]